MQIEINIIIAGIKIKDNAAISAAATTKNAIIPIANAANIIMPNNHLPVAFKNFFIYFPFV